MTTEDEHTATSVKDNNEFPLPATPNLDVGRLKYMCAVIANLLSVIRQRAQLTLVLPSSW